MGICKQCVKPPLITPASYTGVPVHVSAALLLIQFSVTAPSKTAADSSQVPESLPPLWETGGGGVPGLGLLDLSVVAVWGVNK